MQENNNQQIKVTNQKERKFKSLRCSEQVINQAKNKFDNHNEAARILTDHEYEIFVTKKGKKLVKIPSLRWTYINILNIF
jgi:hypothetical protein